MLKWYEPVELISAWKILLLTILVHYHRIWCTATNIREQSEQKLLLDWENLLPIFIYQYQLSLRVAVITKDIQVIADCFVWSSMELLITMFQFDKQYRSIIPWCHNKSAIMVQPPKCTQFCSLFSCSIWVLKLNIENFDISK